MIRRLRSWLNYRRYANSRHPSWRVIYEDGVSLPLTRQDAQARCDVFDGLRIEYCRDQYGELRPSTDWPTLKKETQ